MRLLPGGGTHADCEPDKVHAGEMRDIRGVIYISKRAAIASIRATPEAVEGDTQMRLQAGPREDEPGYEREEDAAHQAQHPGRPKSLTPKVDYRGAAQTGVSHVVSQAETADIAQRV